MSESPKDPAAELLPVLDAEVVPDPPAAETPAPAASEPAASEAGASEAPPPATPPATPTAAPIAVPASDYTDAGVPTFDAVREKIESIAGRAMGARELDADTPAGRSLDEQWEDRQKAARSKLDEIRKSMDS